MKRYASIVELLRDCPTAGDDPVLHGIPAYRATAGLDAAQLAEIRQRRWLSASELASIYAWKEGGRSRHLRDILGNAKDDTDLVQELTREAMAHTDEYKRIAVLDRLQGVGIAIASAILTVIDPQAYGIIDRRVWRLLHEYGEVDHDPAGENLTLESWLDYLPKVRQWATELGASAREVERRLFDFDPAVSYDTGVTAPSRQMMEQVMATVYATDLDTILDQIARLSNEQQEILADILHRRMIEHERREIAEDARAALALFRAGKLRAASADEVIASLDRALSEPDVE